MKKYILLSLFSLCDLNACNLVPVVKLSDQGKQASVYETICNNSLPVLQGRSEKLTLTEINTICADSNGFLSAKIKKQDPQAEIAFLPKSLYQMFVWAQDTHNMLTVGRERHVDPPAMFDTRKKIDCAGYMASPQVQTSFWQVNSFIVDFLKSDFGVEEYNKEQLSNITHHLLEYLRQNSDNKNDSIKWRNMYTGDVAFHENTWPMLDGLIWNEYISRDNYLIYRGSTTQCLDDLLLLDRSISFSDGVFGGIMCDMISGMAFGYWVYYEEPLLMIRIPVEDLLYQKNGAQIFNIPAVTPLGAANGQGEYHHVRIRVFWESSDSAFQNCPMPFDSKINPRDYRELWVDSNVGLDEFKQNYGYVEQIFKANFGKGEGEYRLITIKKNR